MAMEAENWSSQTNWTITAGNLRNCLTFQSSLSFSDDDDDETSNSKSLPLLLHSPSPDSAPCEITINFAEKHELRQVYVRSTARVYEIYCAPDLKSNNEYLCTVRCGVATRDGEVLRSPTSALKIAYSSNNSRDLGDDENVKSEDDWVEVKVDDDNPPAKTKPYNYTINSTITTQDLYEATAEMNDLNPCISVTIRLLSLQSKGCVCVDEIYVFGDPVDSESQESRNENENSSGSSLMAMFLPTLMQLSKTTGLSHLNAARKEKQFVSEDDLKETPHPSISVIKNQLEGKASITDPREVKLKEVKGGSVGPSQPDTLSQVGKMESDRAAVPSQAAQMDSNCGSTPSKIAEVENNYRAVHSQVATNQGNFLGGHVEGALVQLLSRMDRIEELCLGFQEKMVMPMNSIEARLQRVEQQLETLFMKLQSSALPSYCRISAPDASCIESDANFYENCLDHTVTREIDSDKKYVHTEVPNVSPRDMSDSENTTQLLPGLVVTAPEFLEDDDEEDNASEQEMNSSNDKEKKSIDDALSSALANFLSSSLSSVSPKYTNGLTIEAPEFSDEDDDDHESINETVRHDSVHLTDSEKPSHIQVLDLSNIPLESGEKINKDFNDENSANTAQEAEQDDKFCSAQGDQEEVCVKASTSDEHNLGTDFKDNVEEDKNRKINDQETDVFSSNINNISNELVDNQTPGGHSITQEGPSARTELSVATEAPKKTRENIIENVLGFSLASSAVDFETPLLDVKFISQRSPVTEGFLEALLVETSSRDPSVTVKESSEDLSVKEQLNGQGNGDLSVEEHSNLISIDDGELVNQASNTHFDLDQDLCSSITAPVNIEGDNLPEDHKRKHDQIDTSSLI